MTLLRLIIPILYIMLASCNASVKHDTRIVERSFYYWKSVFKLSNFEKQRLDDLHIKTLYIKFFDVGWDDVVKTATPIAQLRINDSAYLHASSINIVPTIFITNECIYKIDTAQTKQLAHKIWVLTKSMIANNGLQNIPEIQIDCDWTASTKDKYFSLLTELQKLEKQIPFSATIRLHQIKYISKTGIPPVKRGMLMCYNMGNLTNKEIENSILDITELKKYIGNLQHYPLPLDVVFPLFDWKVLFRKESFKGLIENLPDSFLREEIFNENKNKFTVIKDTTINGYTFKKDDLIRNEQSAYAAVLRAVVLISEKLSNNQTRVSLYHLDTLTLKKFSAHEMENIYNSMF
jgi:hypothetical protein